MKWINALNVNKLSKFIQGKIENLFNLLSVIGFINKIFPHMETEKSRLI